MKLFFAAVLSGAALATSISSQAFAQVESREGIYLQNQILELKHQLQALQSQGGGSALGAASQEKGGGGASPDLVPELLDRISVLEDQVRVLRGQVEELSHTVDRQGQELGKRIDDLKFQVEGGASSGSAAPAGAATKEGGVSPTSPPPTPLGVVGSGPGKTEKPAPKTPEQLLAESQAALDRHDYATAEKSARAALTRSRGEAATKAQYLMAEALAGQKNYQQAALAFDDAYNRARTGPFAPPSLLGLADSLLNINAKPAACATLNKLRAEFPNLKGELRQRMAALRERAGCH